MKYFLIILLISLYLTIISSWELFPPKTVFKYYEKSAPNSPKDRSSVTPPGPQKTVYVIHGWTGSTGEATVKKAEDLKDKILQNRDDVGVVAVLDWNLISRNREYPFVALWGVPEVATLLAEEVKGYTDQVKGPPVIDFVGHSLGSHVGGQAGKKLKEDGILINEIIGIDPARPAGWKSFDKDPSMCLTTGDAKHVRIIYTNEGFFGIPYNPDGPCKGDTNDRVNPELIEEACKDKWGLMKSSCEHGFGQEYYGMELEGKIPTKRNQMPNGTETTTPNAPISQKRITILVLDVSGSMQDYGRLKGLISSSRNFIQGAEVGSYMGIVLFGSRASIAHQVTKIDEHSRKSLISSLPNEKANYGGTSIGAGLVAALGMFEAGVECPNIILMTDGEENESPYIRDVIPRLENICATLQAISLGSKADQTMENLASRTGGQSYFVSDYTDISDVLSQRFFDAQEAALDSDDQVIQLPSKSIDLYPENGLQGEATYFQIDEDIGRDTKFIIRSPRSDVIQPELEFIPIPIRKRSKRSPSTGFNWRRDNNQIIYDLEDASSGNYSLTIRVNSTQPVIKANIHAISHPRSNQTEAIRLEGQLSSRELNAEPILVQAWVHKGQDQFILGADVYAQITSQFGQVILVKLRDNGGGADGIKNDGIYSGFLGASQFENAEIGNRFDIILKASGLAISRYLNPEQSLDPRGRQDKFKNEDTELYKFERQRALGSLRIGPSYLKEIQVGRVNDLEVISCDLEEQTCRLDWSTPDGVVEYILRGSSDYRIKLEEQWIFPNSSFVEGDLIPKEVGEIHQVVVRIPEDLWEGMKNGSEEWNRIQLYFILQTGFPDIISNVASAYFAFLRDPEFDHEGFGLIWLLSSGATIAILLGCYYFYCKRR